MPVYLRLALMLLVVGLVCGLSLGGGAQGAFPGANGAIVFTSDRGQKGFGLWLSTPDSQELTRLTRHGFEPSWSPDGRRVAFVDYRRGQGGRAVRGRIFVMRTGGAPRQLSHRPVDDEYPTWSPDGSQILFVSARRDAFTDGQADLYVMNANGTRRRRLTGTRHRCEAAPSWSPDSTRIAFMNGCAPGQTFPVYVMNADGSHVRRVAARGGDPAWSPDGVQLVFNDLQGITVMNADGSGRRRLGTGFGFQPAWSPDGAEIIYVKVVASGTCVDNVTRIYAVNVDGSNERRVTPQTCQADDYQPDWQPRCTVYGTARRDVLSGTAGRDVICSLSNGDAVRAAEGDDVVIAGDGKDVVRGDTGQDWLFGSAGNDFILARDGEADVVNGGPGRDRAQIDVGLDRVFRVELLLP